ncbi:MAG: hypothetical protein WBI17_03760 [Clostridiaceae bacterium]
MKPCPGRKTTLLSSMTRRNRRNGAPSTQQASHRGHPYNPNRMQGIQLLAVTDILVMNLIAKDMDMLDANENKLSD